MLTIRELKEAQDQLRGANVIVDAVRVLFLSGGCIGGARLLRDVEGLIGDEIAALNKMIAEASSGHSEGH